MTWGLAGAFAASIAYGAATVLQALGARHAGEPDELDGRLVTRLVHSGPYVLGVSLDGIGFALSFVALRTEPLFTVQAIVASGLAVTAVLAVIVLGARPSIAEWLALVAVTVGLALLALAAAAERPNQLSRTDRLLLLSSVAAIGIVAVVIARARKVHRRNDAWAFGLLAGLMYSAGSIAARVLTRSHAPLRIVSDPALYTLVSAGLLGLLLYAMALQRGSVTVATAVTTVTDTLVPAAVGVFLLGDRPAPGHTATAAAGFVLTVGGAIALARFGEAPARTTGGPPRPTAGSGTDEPIRVAGATDG